MFTGSPDTPNLRRVLRDQTATFTWMRDNEYTKWSIGIKFVQLQKNSALNKGIGRSPYEALFGKCATAGLTSETKIPKEILVTLNVRVNQNAQVTDASVRKMEYCAIVGAIALDHVITNDF